MNSAKLSWFRLKNDLAKDKDTWRKLHHWLHPIRFDQMFEAVGKSAAYEYEGYALNSHFVHLLPVADYLLSFEAKRIALRDIIGNVGAQLVAFLRGLSPVVANQEAVRREMLKPVLRYLYRSVARGGEVLRDASHTSDPISILLGEVTRQDFDYSRLARAALGSPPRDPLAIGA